MESFRNIFLDKYPERGAILRYYKIATGKEAVWNSFTANNLNRFRKYLLDSPDIARSTARRYLTWFSIAMNMAGKDVALPDNWRKYLNVAADVSQNVYLNEDEIKRISTYEPTTDNEAFIKCSFLLGALTGARHSDYMGFSERNIRDGWLSYVSKKTHKEANIPVSPYIISLLRDKSRMSVSLSEPTINNIIRRICANVGITEEVQLYKCGRYVAAPKYKFVTSHTARRSFATNLYLRGADLYQIMKLMGHRSTTQTEGYICCGLQSLSPEINGYFENICSKT